MNKLLLAIPHSSIKLGKLELDNILVEEIKSETLKHADLYTDELFYYSDAITVKFPLSRFSIDVERFWDNDKEKCYKQGQGKFYTKFHNGKEYRREKDIPVEYKRIYWNYHFALEEMIEKEDCNFLVDCHSFNDSNRKYADICLGWNEDETKPSKELIDKICNWLEMMGKTVSFNSPYSGSITVENNKQYKSLMIEVNKNLYLRNDFVKKADFYKTCNLITSILDIIKEN